MKQGAEDDSRSRERTRYKDVPEKRRGRRGKKREGAEINKSREGGGGEES